MKIIFADNFYYIRGGAERVFFDEMEMLREHGHEIIPFSRHFEKNIASEYSKYFAPPFEYEDVSMRKRIAASFKLIYSLECRSSIGALLDLFKPDIFHAHNIYGRLTTSVLDAAKKRNIPVVMTLHDYKLICPSYLMLLNGEVCERCRGTRFYYCTVKRCHKGNLLPSVIYTFETYFNRLFNKYGWVKYFICPSEFLLRKHAEAGIPENKLVHIPNFINTDLFKPDYSAGRYILFVGRLSKEKGVLTLLKAVTGLEVTVRIVGEGPMKKEFEVYARENKMNNVVFEGYRTGSELVNLYRNAAFLVVPSEWYETFGLIITEAFAYGKPVIGSAIGGIPEILIEGGAGILFKPGDYRELREKIKYLLTDPKIITLMGKKARRKVEEQFNAEIHYQRLMEVYEKAGLPNC